MKDCFYPVQFAPSGLDDQPSQFDGRVKALYLLTQ